ncbi:TetR/AcrR family transcriptional regulator [Vibrio sp.]|nr:TetR/AcrR family transcriptional regulator [Vibrio sp.]
MSKVEQNRMIKKRAILASARLVFLQEGFTSAKMDDIASEAGVTKQTLYRYYASKPILFEATLKSIGEEFDEKHTHCLSHSDTDIALLKFAIHFMEFHLSPDHLAIQRLLISEANNIPDQIEAFMKIGPDDELAIRAFFNERFNADISDIKIDLWFGMLLAPRSKALLGSPMMSRQAIEYHAKEAIDMLLSSI